jgi:N utilization substance protein A
MKKTVTTDVLVIGGGAAGCMAALTAAKEGVQVALWERNPKIGRKLYITGKGRCNLTNNSPVRTCLDNTPGNPKIILSRTSPVFLQRLLESEVPEIAEGIIAVRKIARIPGDRAKIAVESFDDRIDPVGACVGVRGSRVHGIVRELRGENLDVIQWSNNPQILIARALGPAEINSINLDLETKHCEVYLDPDQVSLAIGKGGMNIRLASMLTDTVIDVYRELPEGEEEELEDDIHLDDFKDEIDEWVIDELKKNGWTTARSVLEAPRDMLVQKNEDPYPRYVEWMEEPS